MVGVEPANLEELTRVVAKSSRSRRSVIAVAGAPASGNSTLADELAARLNADEPGSAAVLAMDGYHYDDLVLDARGHRPRKGAPFTFDVGGFGHMLARLRANEEEEIAVPVFDRSIEIARNAARIIPQSVHHLIVEGNYLLLDRPPWSKLRIHYDTSVFLRVPEDVLRERLLERWKHLKGEELRAKMDDNDLPNALLVARESGNWDFVLDNV